MHIRLELYNRVHKDTQIVSRNMNIAKSIYGKADEKNIVLKNGVRNINQEIRNEIGNNIIIMLNLLSLNSSEINYINEWIKENKEEFTKSVAYSGIKKDRSRYIDIIMSTADGIEIKKELGLSLLESATERIKFENDSGENLLELNLRTNLDVGGY